MVLPLTAEARTALETSHASLYRAQAFYGPDQTLDVVPLHSSGSLTFDGGASVQSSGTVNLMDTGTDYVPKHQTDTFAPFGQELAIQHVVPRDSGGDIVTPLGRFRIADVPDMADYWRRWPSQQQAGWSLQLTVRDRLDILQNDDFVTPTSATPGGSTWDEIQRIAPQGLGIARSSLIDTVLPAGITYSNLPDAMTKLMSNLGGVPHMRRDGLLTARQKDKWLTATTPEFTVNGTVNVNDSMSIKLYNCVVLTNPNNPAIVAIKQIDDPSHPLRVTGPLGRRVYKMADPLMVTQPMADAAALTALGRLSSQQTHIVKFSCLPRPDLELGDFGDVVDEVSGRTYRGEIATMSFSLDPTGLMSGSMYVAQVIRP